MLRKLVFAMLAAGLFLGGFLLTQVKERPSLGDMSAGGLFQDLHLTRLKAVPLRSLNVSSDEWDKEHKHLVRLSGKFSKDSDGAYWDSMKIIGADPDSFDVYNDQYAHDQSNVYYGEKNSIYVMIGADRESFSALGDGYAKDRNHAYFRGKEMFGADPDTFVKLGPIDVLYAKDRNSVYLNGESLPGFDAPSFRIDEKDGWPFSYPIYLIDKNKVSLGPSRADGESFEIREIPGADPETFVELGWFWGKDVSRVFYDTTLLDGADPTTIQVLGTHNGSDATAQQYAKDRHAVYYRASKIVGADAGSFRVAEDVQLLRGSFGEDDRSAYRDGEPFPKEDIASFRRGKIPSSAKSVGGNYFAYDGKAYYYSPTVQAPASFDPVYADSAARTYADISTFKSLGGEYARDSANIYCDGHILRGVDLDTFSVLGGDRREAKDRNHAYVGCDIEK